LKLKEGPWKEDWFAVLVKERNPLNVERDISKVPRTSLSIPETNELNSWYNVSRAPEEWETITALDLRNSSEELFQKPFPDSFAKLKKIKTIDLRRDLGNEEKLSAMESIPLTSASQRQFFIAGLEKMIEKELVLGGLPYKMISIVSKTSKEGLTAKVEHGGKFYALKVYYKPKQFERRAIFGDLAVIQRARASREDLVMPDYVDMDREFTLFPFIEGKTIEGEVGLTQELKAAFRDRNTSSSDISRISKMYERAGQQIKQFHSEKLDHKLEKDRLKCGDPNPGNYIIEEKTGKIYRIDFGDCWVI
jgi:hypothetical protein